MGNIQHPIPARLNGRLNHYSRKNHSQGLKASYVTGNWKQGIIGHGSLRLLKKNTIIEYTYTLYVPIIN